MTDQITDLAAVGTAMTKFQEALTKIDALFTGETTLSTNKEEFAKAWTSANATTFQGQYAKLITCMTDARTSLTNYYARLADVFARFSKFDNTFNAE